MPARRLPTRLIARLGAARVGVAVVAGYALLVAALFWRVWMRGQMSGWDCAVEYWPDLIFESKSIAHAHWPGWNPYALGGYPFWADPQTGLYHPASWLCWLGAAIAGTGPWLVQAKVFVNLLAGLCGMHAWTHARTRSHAAAAVAALTLVLGSPLLVMKNSAVSWPLLYAPWALWATERFVASPTMRRGAALAGATWLVAGAGSPPGTFYVALAVVAYGAFLALASPTPRATPALVARAWRGLAVLAVLTGLLLAAIYVPALTIATSSQRATRGLDYVLQQPLAWRELDELAAPNLDTNWMHDLYMGPIALAGGLWLVAFARTGRARAEAGFWLGVVALGLLLALGRAGHVLPALAAHAPGFGLFRIAYRYKMVAGIAAAVLAGDAAAALGRGDVSRAGRIAWSALAVAWVATAAAVGGRATAVALAAGGLAALVAAAWLGRRRVATIALALVPALVLADLWHAGASKLAILQKRPDPWPKVAAAAVMDGTDGPWRYHVGNPSSPYGGTVPYQVAFLGERRELSGYTHPMQSLRHVEITKRAKQSPELLRHFNVRYFAGHRRPPAGARAIAPGIVAVDDVAPLVRWYGATEVAAPNAILDRLAAAPPSAKRVAYVEEGDARGVALPVAADPPPPVDGRLVRYEPDEVVVEVDAPAAGVVVLAEAWAPGWTAEVDGRAARVLRADYFLRAVLVPAGTSRIVFRYEPRGRVALPLAFLLGLVGLGVLGLGRWRWLDGEGELPGAAGGGDDQVREPQAEGGGERVGGGDRGDLAGERDEHGLAGAGAPDGDREERGGGGERDDQQ